MAHICYDISRLLTRLARSTPNGIDRVDHMLASHVLRAQAGDVSAAIPTLGRPLLIEPSVARDALLAVGVRWREGASQPSHDPELARVSAFLTGQKATVPVADDAPQRGTSSLRALARLFRAARLRGRVLPPQGIYLNASQFPLWLGRPFCWLSDRPDVSGVFFIHDLLPIQVPAYFPAGEAARHKQRLLTFARHGRAAIVSTPAVADDLRSHLERLGRLQVPIHVAPLPVSPFFDAPRREVEALARRPFFVMCSTLEPRKNHLLALQVWSRLIDRLGENAPFLVLVGKRGWKFSPTIDLLRSSAALRRHVVETNSLSTPALKLLLDQARALVMPTFGEGYGLPVYEALTSGVPVVASDITAFRHIRADGLTLLSPHDLGGWTDTILAMSAAPRSTSCLMSPALDRDSYFEGIDTFLGTL